MAGALGAPGRPSARLAPAEAYLEQKEGPGAMPQADAGGLRQAAKSGKDTPIAQASARPSARPEASGPARRPTQAPIVP